MKHIEQRMSALEEVVMKLANVQLGTQVSIDNLSKEMKEFKTAAEQENRAINRRWAELAYKMGTIVEDIVAPNIPWVARTYFGAEVIEDFMIRRKKTKSSDRSAQREFDIIAVFDGKVILNETRATLCQDNINDFVGFIKEGEFFDYFPEYRDKKLIPIFSSLYVPDNMVKQLTKQKICVMACGTKPWTC